jgi:polar amino acid transport system substrate-binding protein
VSSSRIYRGAIALASVALLMGIAVPAMGASKRAPKVGSPGYLYSQVPKAYKHGFTVAMQNAQPPEAYVTNGKVEGISPNLVRAIGVLLGVKIKIAPTTFENELLGLEAGRNAFVTDTNVTATREGIFKQFAYYNLDYEFLTLKTQKTIGAVSDLCGTTTGDETGDGAIPFIIAYSQNSCVAKGLAPITLVQQPTYGDLVLALASGQIASLTIPSDAGAYLLKQPASSSMQAGGFTYNKVEVGFSFPMTSKLVPVVVKAMKQLVKNGKYRKIMNSYGYGPRLQTTSFVVDPAPLTPTP